MNIISSSIRLNYFSASIFLCLSPLAALNEPDETNNNANC